MDTSDIRKGLQIMVDDQPYVVIDFQYVKPGKGQPFTRVKLRGMETGVVLERVYKSGEKLEKADVEERSVKYNHPDGDDFVFTDEALGEQITVPGAKVGDHARWLSEGLSVDITVFKGRLLGVSVPSNVVLQVVQSEPGLKGDTTNGATKPATLSTGAVVNVPLFIQDGEWVKVDTREGRYLERVSRP
jgi:elongation factor P